MEADTLHDSNICTQLINKLMQVIVSEPSGSEFEKKAIGTLIILGKGDNKVKVFQDQFRMTGHDHHIKKQISIFTK